MRFSTIRSPNHGFAWGMRALTELRINEKLEFRDQGHDYTQAVRTWYTNAKLCPECKYHIKMPEMVT